MWNKFEASSTEEEALSNSFSTVGLFKISNEEKSTKNPRVNASLQNNKITIAVDKSLVFLEDKSLDDCKFLNFAAEIDCFAVTKCGDLIVCCLADGNIHGVHIKGIPVFNLMIQEEDVNSEGSFLDIIHLNDEFVIMCSNGRVYKLSNIDQSKLTEIANTTIGDFGDLNESILNTVSLVRVTNSKVTSKISAFCCLSTFDGDMFIGCAAGHVIFITQECTERTKFPEDVGFIKKIFNLDSYIIAITDSGSFVEVCPYTKTVNLINHSINNQVQTISDVRLLESNHDYVELLILTTPTEQKSSSMKTLDFPSMKVKNELTLPGTSWLVSLQKSSVNMYYISGTQNESGFIETIEIKSIIETIPEERFKKLLLRGHFEEAEEFAKQFNLNLEPLHEARVKKSLKNLQIYKPTSAKFSQTFSLLLEQLTLITEPKFLVSLRSKEIPDRASMTTFLEYLLKNIDTNEYQTETNEINELLLRLETLRLIDPDQCNLQWQSFLYHKDMARVAMDFFKTDVLLSCLIWSRHSSSIMPNLQLEQFHKWLNLIPSTVEPFQLIQWLKHFSPCFLQIYPTEMTYLVDWCLQRTRGLQFSNTWPEIGLEFINNINGIFQDVKFMIVDIRRSYHNNMEKIQQLIFTLEEMAVLKKTYHLTMTLDDYSKQSIEESAFRLLQRIQTNNLTGMVNDFLYPIFMERGGSPEETIVKYIQFLCNNKNLGFWQERAVKSIELLHNEENRLSSALLVLKVSPVPWSDIVLPLAMLGTTSTHPLANSIYIEYKTHSIKLIKVKYQWPVDYFDLQHDRIQLLFRILKVNNPEMIEDVKSLIKSSPDITHDAYTFLLNDLVDKGRIEEFVEVIDDIKDNLESSHEFFSKIADFFIIKVDEDDFDDEQEADNFTEGLKLLASRLKTTIDKYQLKRMEELKKLVKLRRQFHFKLRLKDLNSAKTKKKTLEEGIALITANVEDKKSIDGMWSEVDLLVGTLGFDRFRGYQLFCQKLNNLFVTCHIIDVLCQSIDNVGQDEIESALDLVILLISQQVAYFENNVKPVFDHYDPLSFLLAFEFLVKCMTEYKLRHHLNILELMNWMRIGRSYYPYNAIEATRKERVVDESIFVSKMSNGVNGITRRRETFSMFEEEEHVVVKQQQADENLNPVLRCVCNCLKVVLFATNTRREPFKRFVKFLEASDVKQVKDDFFMSLENILKMKQYDPVVSILEIVVEHQTQANVLIVPQVFITNVNKKILKFLLSQKDPEYMKAFRILKTEVNRDECMESLRSNLKNNSQKIAFSTFSEMFNNYLGNKGKVHDERQNRLKFYYYSELCKYDQTLRFKINFDNIDINDMLKDLQTRQLSVELLKKLTKDFGLDYQKSLIQQIKILLRSQELDFEIKTDVFGKDEVIVNSSVEMIRKKCSPYLNEITNTSLLASDMQSFIKEINFYFYEMYLIVLEMIEHAKELTMEQTIFRNILLLLKLMMTGKRRRNDHNEVEAWQKLQPDNGVLPKIAKYRIPFKPLMESTPEAYLNEELNVDTFEKCIPLISLHATCSKANVEDRLEVCAFQAVKNSVMDMKAKMETKNSAEWNLKPTNNAFLHTLLRMVTLLKDKSKRMAILYFHVNHSPEGSDQVEVAFECWKFAIAHEEELVKSPKYGELVSKIKRKYPLLKTQHLLHLYGLTDDKLMQYVESPTDLINALYHHESIMLPQKKDINKLCRELALLYDIDLLSLQHKLLHKWLAFVGESMFEECDVNETVYEDFIGSAAEEGNVEFISDENVARAHYILSSWNNQEAMSFLASEFNFNSANTENQLQLYECFAKLVDDSTESYMELMNPNDYLLIKSCHYLKQFGLKLKPESFKDMNKVEILKKLWSSQCNNSKGLEAMSLICLGFNIHLPQIWNGILKQMIALKMVPHLAILVEILSTQSKLLHLSNLKLAWECVIMEPFLNATRARSYEQDLNLSKAFILLQKCPISTFLNMENLIEQCLRLDRPYMAAIFVTFLKEQQRGKFVEILETFDKREMKKSILELEEMGVAPIITKSVVNILKL